MTEPAVPEQLPARLRCVECSDELDECACCNEPACSKAVCYGCLAVAVGQTASQPHEHGG